ncbi:MAG TPA: TetR/AcrR family transcriptional regulator [Amycolatopsis sp.]|nr:TetR/AcrR family transcriptional regulator [Amycolatopsis sp.]
MSGLRERKKQATRTALSEAALRLAVEHGPDNVRVDDIATAAGVSPRTYNNYFPSREAAIVFAVTADREARVAAAVEAAGSAPLSRAVADAVVTTYTAPAPETLRLITASPALRNAYADTALEPPLAAALSSRVPDATTARVLAAAVTAAVRIALAEWAQPTGGGTGFVVVSGSLPDRLRAALAPLNPALDAAAG